MSTSLLDSLVRASEDRQERRLAAEGDHARYYQARLRAELFARVTAVLPAWAHEQVGVGDVQTQPTDLFGGHGLATAHLTVEALAFRYVPRDPLGRVYTAEVSYRCPDCGEASDWQTFDSAADLGDVVRAHACPARSEP